MFRWRLGATALIAGVLACGGRAHSPRSEPEPASPALTPDETPSAGLERLPPAATPDEAPGREMMPNPVSSPMEESGLNEFDDATRQLLDERCGSCHSHGVDPGGIGDILDLASLLEQGWLRQPAEASPLVLMLRYGDNIAAHSFPLLAEGELDALVRFIDGLETLVAGCGSVFEYSSDAFQRVLLDDISRYPMSDRTFIRYVAKPDIARCSVRSAQNLMFDVMNGTSTARSSVLPRWRVGVRALQRRRHIGRRASRLPRVRSAGARSRDLHRLSCPGPLGLQ